MITLYQLHWSHYVEKVRWALDYKGLEWSAVEVEPFSKRQMRHLQTRTTLDSGRKLYTAPTIHDEATGAVLSESSAIVEYLERTYPTPALYPAETQARDDVTRWMLWLDSTLGLAARRLAYTQIAVEYPGILADLFVPHVAAKGAGSLKARLAGAIIAGVLAQRFRFLHNREDRVFEELEPCLLIAAARLSSHPYLVADQFTAADVTLAALLRPMLLVPFFQGHPRLQGLFEWRDRQVREHRRELQVGYQKTLHDIRQQRGWALGGVSWLSAERHDTQPVPTEIPALQRARNDQQQLPGWPLITGPIWYLRLKQGCGLTRTAYR